MTIEAPTLTVSELQRLLEYRNQLQQLLNQLNKIELYNKDGNKRSHRHLTDEEDKKIEREINAVNEYIKLAQIETTHLVKNGNATHRY